MIIHGREVHFLLTTGAMSEIAKLCPGKDLKKISEIMDNTADMFETTAKIAASMSKWYELEQAYTHADYRGRALTADECLTLRSAEFTELVKEVREAFTTGQSTVIELKDKKKEETDADTL